MKQEQAKSLRGEKRKPMTGFFVSCSHGESIARDPKDYALASLLCRFLSLSDEVTGGVINNAREVLKDPLKLGGMYLNKNQIRRILSRNSQFWRWEEPRKENLIVTLFDAECEAKFANRSKALTSNIQSRWRKSKASKADSSVNTNVNTNVNTKVCTNVDTIKEIKDFSSKNLSKGGCFSEDTHPAFDKAKNEDDSAPSSPEETEKFFAELRAAFSKPETGGGTDRSTEDKPPETENASERP